MYTHAQHRSHGTAAPHQRIIHDDRSRSKSRPKASALDSGGGLSLLAEGKRFESGQNGQNGRAGSLTRQRPAPVSTEAMKSEKDYMKVCVCVCIYIYIYMRMYA